MLVILSEMRGRSSLREDNEVFQGRGTLDFRALVVATAPFLTLLITATGCRHSSRPPLSKHDIWFPLCRSRHSALVGKQTKA